MASKSKTSPNTESAAVNNSKRISWRYKGKSFTLHKQPTSTNWYVEFEVDGKRFRPSLKTPDVGAAKLRAQAAWQEAVDASFRPEQPKAAEVKKHATIGEVLACYAAHIHSVSEDIEADTVTGNVARFRRLALWSRGLVTDPKKRVSRYLQNRGQLDDDDAVTDALPTTVLTASWIDAAVSNYLASANGDERLVDQRRRGITSLVRTARSIFKPEALRLYREQGLHLPDLWEFLKGRPVSAPRVEHRSIDPKALREMHAAAQEFASTKPDLYLAHLLFKFCGLRNKEIDELQVNWFERAPWGQFFLVIEPRGSFRPKASNGIVPICKEVMSEIVQALGARIDRPEEPVLGPNGWVRYKILREEHSQFMRQFLPKDDFRKSSYELRRWASQIIRARYGSDAGEAFIRHAKVSTAARHYFERRYPWRNLGTDVGITLDDARGLEKAEEQGEWLRGGAALRSLRHDGSALRLLAKEVAA